MNYPELLRKKELYQAGRASIPELTLTNCEQALEIEYTHNCKRTFNEIEKAENTGNPYPTSAEVISLFCRININTKRDLPICASEMGLLIFLVKSKEPIISLQAAEFFRVSKPIVAAMVNPLEKKGYLTRGSLQRKIQIHGRMIKNAGFVPLNDRSRASDLSFLRPFLLQDKSCL